MVQRYKRPKAAVPLEERLRGVSAQKALGFTECACVST